MAESDEAFNPRAAALAHAYTAAVGAEMRDQGGSAKPIDGDAVQAIAAGLVYVGDQIGRFAPPTPDPAHTLAYLSATLLDVVEGMARFSIGPFTYEVRVGEAFRLYVEPDGRAPDVRIDRGYKDALEKIAKLDESFADAPMEDRMRAIAVGALAAGER